MKKLLIIDDQLPFFKDRSTITAINVLQTIAPNNVVVVLDTYAKDLLTSFGHHEDFFNEIEYVGANIGFITSELNSLKVTLYTHEITSVKKFDLENFIHSYGCKIPATKVADVTINSCKQIATECKSGSISSTIIAEKAKDYSIVYPQEIIRPTCDTGHKRRRR